MDSSPTEMELKLVSDILQDEEFISALNSKLNIDIPKPYNNIEDYLNAIPVYDNRTITNFLKDLNDLRFDLKKISPQRNKVTVFQEQQVIDNFKARQPKFLDPIQLAQSGLENSSEHYKYALAFVNGALSTIKDKLTTEQLQRLLPPDYIDQGNDIDSQEDIMASFISMYDELYSVSEYNELDEAEQKKLKNTALEFLKEATAFIAINKITSKYDILSWVKKLRFEKENHNNALNILEDLIQNKNPVISTLFRSTGIKWVLKAVLKVKIKALENERYGYQTDNALNEPNEIIKHHHSALIKDLDKNKQTTKENPTQRASMIRFIAHQFEALQTKSNIESLENELLRSDLGVLTPEHVLPLEKTIKDLRNKEQTILLPQDVEVIKSFTTGDSFEEPLRSLIRDFNESTNPSKISISYLASKTMIKKLTDPQINIPKTSPLIDTTITGTQDFPEMIKFISDQDNYGQPDKLTLVRRKVSDLNEILNFATDNLTESTGLEERLIIANFNPEYIYHQNLKTRFSQEIESSKHMVMHSIKDKVAEIDSRSNECINKLAHHRPHKAYTPAISILNHFTQRTKSSVATAKDVLIKSKDMVSGIKNIKFNDVKTKFNNIKAKTRSHQPQDLKSTATNSVGENQKYQNANWDKEYDDKKKNRNSEALEQLENIKNNPNITDQKFEFIKKLEKMISGGVMNDENLQQQMSEDGSNSLQINETNYYSNLTDFIITRPDQLIKTPTIELIMTLGFRNAFEREQGNDEQTVLDAVDVETYIRDKVEDLCKDGMQQDHPDTIFKDIPTENLMPYLETQYKASWRKSLSNDKSSRFWQVRDIMNACHIHAGKTIQQVEDINEADYIASDIKQKMNEFYKNGQLINPPCSDFSKMSISSIKNYLKTIFNEKWQELPNTAECEQDNDQSLPTCDSKEKQFQSDISHWMDMCGYYEVKSLLHPSHCTGNADKTRTHKKSQRKSMDY